MLGAGPGRFSVSEIRAVATVWEGVEIFFCPANNAWFHWFRVGKLYDIWTQWRQSVRRWKLSEQNFENFTTVGRFSKKTRKIAQKIAGLAISGRHNSAMITNDENWRPNSPSTGCLVFTFTIRINSKSFSWAVRCAQENISIEYFPWFAWIHSRRIIILHAAAAFGLVLVVIQYHKIVWVRLAQKDRFVIDVSPLCLHSQIHLPPTVTLADSYTASDEQYSL